QARLAVWDLVRALRRDGVAVLLTTHLMDEAAALADEVVIVDRGRRVASGAPAELERTGTAEGVTLVVDGELDPSLLHGATGTEHTIVEGTAAGVLEAHGHVSPRPVTSLCRDPQRA